MVDQILRQTESPELDREKSPIPGVGQRSEEEAMEADSGQSHSSQPSAEGTPAAAEVDSREWSPLRASKAILTGMQVRRKFLYV